MRRSFMEKETVLLLLLFALKAFSQDPDTSKWIAIDCGSLIAIPTSYKIVWQTDDGFIKTGKNGVVSASQTISDLPILNTLRYFPTQNKNCYTLPATKMTRYFVRASFHYGNYDQWSRPPTFDLEIDGNKWITISSSDLSDVVYHEMIYTSTGQNMSVCLSRTQTNQNPFISTLEAWPIPDTMYTNMRKDLAWFKNQRLNYGAQDPILGYPDDHYNRIWEAANQPEHTNVVSTTATIKYTTLEFPPDSAITDAVEATDTSNPLVLTFENNKIAGLVYVETYFTEMRLLSTNETRVFDVYINEAYMLTSPQYRNCTGIYGTISDSGPSITITLNSTPNSTLPSIISAIEVYVASDPLVTTRTSQDDLDGLSLFINNFDELNGWSGEPCLPSDTVWQWVSCTGNYPPRITSIKLSGYALKGSLPDFSQMQALETIDLSDNFLNGLIPEFLGNLPNLQLLNLQRNEFSGNVPQSLLSNKKIKLRLDGNPSLNYHSDGTKNTALIIGLSVGLSLAALLIVTALTFFIIHKRKMISNTQYTSMTSAPGPGGSQVPSDPSESIAIGNASIVQMVRPSEQNNGQMHSDDNRPDLQGDGVLVLTGDNRVELDLGTEGVASANQLVHDGEASMVPEMDMDELDDLLRQHGSAPQN